jgi:hypothetical protein
MLPDQNRRLVGPSSSHVTHRIATAAQNEGWQAKILHETNTVGMTFHCEVETAETIARQTVTATLQDNGLGAIVVHACLDNGLKDALVRRIINPIAKRKID